MIGLLVGVAALGGGFAASRQVVRTRLRYVDAVDWPVAPLLAGLAAAALALPFAALPVVTIATAAALGVGVAGGVVSGRRAAEPP